MEHWQVFHSKLALADYESALSFLDHCINGGGPHQICFANVHTIMLALEDPAFNHITNSASATFMDGLPLVWLARLLGCRKPCRVAGPDLFERVCSSSVQKGYRHFLYGGANGVSGRMKTSLENRYPGIQIVGAVSPPFRPLTPKEDKDIVDTINRADPQILWVGLGAPKQEKWIFEHLEKIRVPVQVGIGAAFDFTAGTVRRAPERVQRMGLEWLYRLTRDPARLWKRYLITNFRFILRVIPEVIQRRWPETP